MSKRRPARICQVCNKEYFTRAVKYCSKTCNGLGKRRENNYRWGGGKFQTAKGYIHISIPRSDKKQPSSRKEHILIAEQILGRPLKKNECVHHINGNKADNRHSNLLICDRSYHTYLHNKMSLLYQQEHFA